jgi:subtilisin family serine protease
MIKSLLLLSTLFVSLVLTIPTGNQVTFQFDQHDHDSSDIIPGEYIVLLKEKTGEEFLASHDRQFADNTMFVYSHGFAAKLSQDQVSALLVDNDVLLVEKNQKVSIAKVQRGAPWGLARISQRELNWVDRYVYPSTAGQGVSVYVLDTGIKVNHAEFAGGKAKSGFNAFPEEGGDDLNSHGTQCASIVCGWKYGVAKRANVIGVKVLNQDGSGSYAGVIAGLDWSVQHFQNSGKKAVASMSLGGPKSVALETSVRKAVSAGLPVIVAAGNSAEDACISSPSGAAEAITVGAINLNGEFASFSNYGPCVDILAPGKLFLYVKDSCLF